MSKRKHLRVRGKGAQPIENLKGKKRLVTDWTTKQNARREFYLQTEIDERLQDQSTNEPLTTDLDEYRENIDTLDWRGIDDKLPDNISISNEIIQDKKEVSDPLAIMFEINPLRKLKDQQTFKEEYFHSVGDLNTMDHESYEKFKINSDDHFKNNFDGYARAKYKDMNLFFIFIDGVPIGYTVGHIKDATFNIVESWIKNKYRGKNYFEYLRREVVNFADNNELSIYTGASPKDDDPDAPKYHDLFRNYTSWGNAFANENNKDMDDYYDITRPPHK